MIDESNDFLASRIGLLDLLSSTGFSLAFISDNFLLKSGRPPLLGVIDFLASCLFASASLSEDFLEDFDVDVFFFDGVVVVLDFESFETFFF